MNSTTTAQTTQDLILEIHEQIAAQIAQRYQARLGDLAKAHRRERYIDYMYGDDALIAEHFALDGGCEPEADDVDECAAIIGQHYDRLTDAEIAAVEKRLRQQHGSLYFNDFYYDDELREARAAWMAEIQELADLTRKQLGEQYLQTLATPLSDDAWKEARNEHERKKAEATVITMAHSPYVFNCQACGQYSYSHDETGHLIAGVGLWALVTGEPCTFLVCETCKGNGAETDKALAQYFNEPEVLSEEEKLKREKQEREFEERREQAVREIEDMLAAHMASQSSAASNTSAAGKAGNTGGSQPGAKSKSTMLIEALDDLHLSFRLNQLEDVIEVDGKPLDDVMAAGINLKLGDKGFSRPNIADGITVVAGRDAYHPVKDYLLGLRWNGGNHLASLMRYFMGDGTLITYRDGTQAALHAALIGRWLIGTAARALETSNPNPFKHQTPMLVLVTGQGSFDGNDDWVHTSTKVKQSANLGGKHGAEAGIPSQSDH